MKLLVNVEIEGDKITFTASNGRVYALRDSNHDTVEHLMKFNVHRRGNDCLEWAMERGHIGLIKFLINNRVVHSGHTFRMAAEYGHHEIVELLLENPRVNPAARDNHAFLMASRNGHIKVVELLADLPGVDLEVHDNSAITGAAGGGHLDVVKFLVRRMVNPAVRDNCALAVAADRGHLELVKYLVKLPGVDSTARNHRAIWWAAEGQHFDVVQFLAGINGSGNDRALGPVARDGHLETVKYLVKSSTGKLSLGNPLKWAIMKGHVDVVKFLMKLPGAVISRYALEWAIYYGRIEMVKFLITLPKFTLTRQSILLAASRGNVNMIYFLVGNMRMTNPHGILNDDVCRIISSRNALFKETKIPEELIDMIFEY